MRIRRRLIHLFGFHCRDVEDAVPYDPLPTNHYASAALVASSSYWRVYRR